MGGSRSRQHLSEFQLPDGTRVLVALPSAAAALREKHPAPPSDNKTSATATEVDIEVAATTTEVRVVVHGSDEHAALLRAARDHHAGQQAAVRARLDAVLVDELDRAGAQLAAVSAQLDRLQRVDRADAAGLSRNFEKFGFDAAVRTYREEGPASSRSSVYLGSMGGEEGEEGGGGAEMGWSDRSGGETVRLFRRPRVKQYFHKGLLWRAPELTEVMSFELFFDLLYVGIIAINGDHAAEEANGHELLRFVVTFCMSCRIWQDVAQVISWFETDDVLQRLEIIFLIACLLGLTTNMLQTFSAENDTFTPLVAFYLAARLFMGVYYAATAFLLPLVRGMMVSIVLNIVVGALLWIASVRVSPSSASGSRLALVFLALAVDLFGTFAPVLLFRYSRPCKGPISRALARAFDFYPALNIEHKVERTGAFVTLVLGYSVVGVIFQASGRRPSPGTAFLGKAVLGLVQAFAFNWLYFEVDGHAPNVHTHAIRRNPWTAVAWQQAHLLFAMAFVLAGAALSRLVLATDCADAPADALTDAYAAKAEPEVPIGLRMYYCFGLGVALLSLGVVAACHEHKRLETRRLSKPARLANRGLVCAVLLVLPAAGDRLSSLGLVATTTGLSVWTLVVELWGKSCTDESFFGLEGRCSYTASCTKRELKEAVKSDGASSSTELGRVQTRAGADAA